MSLYKHFSKVYDLFNTNYDWCIQFVEEAIEEHTEGVQSLLELACGTGNILQHFVGKYEVSGLDLSASMLAQAREKLPGVPLYEMDMSAFELDKTYDAILCMYDSINHLLEYDDWIGTFNSVRRHLNPGGVFVFDMNTLARLDHKAQLPRLVQQEDDAYLIMTVTKRTDRVTNWNVKVFQRVERNLYEFSEEDIEETSFPQEKVKEDLEALFDEVYLHTLERPPDLVRGRVFFVCKA